MSDVERLEIRTRGVGPKHEKKFLLDIQEAILDGWRIADNNVRVDQSRKLYNGRWGVAVLYKETVAKAESKVAKVKEEPKTEPVKKTARKSKGEE